MMTLVELFAAKRVDSFEKFGKRARTSGANAHRFATGRNSEFPSVETIIGFAEALGVSPALVVMATAQGLGIDMSREVEGSMLARALPDEVDELPDYAKQHLIDTARTLVAAMRGLREIPDDDTDAADIDEIASAARRRADRAIAGAAKTQRARKQ